jgi:hypothetical protein
MTHQHSEPSKTHLQRAHSPTQVEGIGRIETLWVGAIHITLVLLFLQIFEYRPVFDSLRYLHVADEFRQLRFSDADPAMHCNTAPGYPLFLAVLSPITGHNTYAIAFLQAMLFVIGLRSLVNALVRTGVIDHGRAIWYMLIPLLIPDIIHVNGWVLTESLTTSLLLILMAGTLFKPASPAAQVGWILAGTMLVLTKFEYLIVVFIAAGYLAFKGRRTPLISLGAILLAVLVLNAWRNATIYGRPNPFSFGSGTVVYGGNNLNGDGSWHMPSTTPGYIPQHAQGKYDRIASLDADARCLEQDRFFKDLAMEAWQQDPVQQLRTIPLKFLKLWLLPADLDIYTLDTHFVPGLQLGTLFRPARWPLPGVIRHATELLFHWMVLTCLILGLAIRVRQRELTEGELLIITVALTLSLLYAIPFYGLGRFHVPALMLVSYLVTGPVMSAASWTVRHLPSFRRSM